ncbi:MAG: hypothetical protein K2I01_03370 [Lachnospiraceae bacterium]|nr:hypothetical protein [Lachnospiraceae bacterium]
MKKVLDIVAMLCALAAGIGLLVLCGSPFLKLQAGARTLGPSDALAEAEGEYVTYEAAYPVASCEAEYYSGDPDRVEKMGYVVYDEARQAFVYIIINERDDARLSNLMHYLEMNVEQRESRDMTPFVADGSLKLMDSAAARQVQKALDNGKVANLYLSYSNDGDFTDRYFGDQYGEAMKGMCALLNEGQQSEWYYIEEGSIDGLSKGQIWLCMLTALFSLLIFVFSLISLLKEKKKDSFVSGRTGFMGELLDAIGKRMAQQCEQRLKRTKLTAFLTAAGVTLGLVVIGFAAGLTFPGVLVFHFPLGLLLGEMFAVVLWKAQSGQSKPHKIVKKIEKQIKQSLPQSAEQEAFAEDILSADNEWDFTEEVGSEPMIYGTVGSRYWVRFTEFGLVTIVDSARLAKIETEKTSGSIRVNKVRTYYHSYDIRFFYQSAEVKKRFDVAFTFNLEETAGLFMTLVRRRVGEKIEIVAK